MGEMRLSGLDDSVSPVVVAAALAAVGGCGPADVKVGEILISPARLGTVWAKCPLTALSKLAASGRMAPPALSARSLQCFRCLEKGHVRQKCTCEVDQSDCCYVYGEETIPYDIGDKVKWFRGPMKAICDVAMPQTGRLLVVGRNRRHSAELQRRPTPVAKGPSEKESRPSGGEKAVRVLPCIGGSPTAGHQGGQVPGMAGAPRISGCRSVGAPLYVGDGQTKALGAPRDGEPRPPVLGPGGRHVVPS
uniref:uncharacterized protein LOC117609686 n=1 Tax=Osmia lignaria TaxID=473952 RepID=UPI001478514A|nr:uncharacterized protein LOC117609686 [Osmia lignaria]